MSSKTRPILKKNLELKRIGSLDVPFSQGKFAQLLLWLQNETTEESCPIDLSILPDGPSSPDLLADGDVFFFFREVKIEATEDRNEIVFVYDRMRVESGGVDKNSVEYEVLSSNTHPTLIDQVSQKIYDNYQIVISKDLLKRLREENPALKETTNEEDFIETLKDFGLFSTSVPTINSN